MRNIKAFISFCGTAYHGFQRQENAIAVQNIVEERLSLLLKSDIIINGCSRTDAGVHANEFCINFKTNCGIPCENLVRGINNLLPDDIAFLWCEETSQDFHARFSCKAKEYEYLIYNAPIKNVFLSCKALHYPYLLNVQLMDKAAKFITGTHDFTSFCVASDRKENCIRTIEYCNVVKDSDNIVRMLIKGDGFLYNMVRIIAGTLIYVNENKFSAESIPEIIRAKDRTLAGITVKPHGLYLNKVFY